MALAGRRMDEADGGGRGILSCLVLILGLWGRSAALGWGLGVESRELGREPAGMRWADLDLRGEPSAHSESRTGRPFLVITETHVALLPLPASPVPPSSSLSSLTGFILAPDSTLSHVQAWNSHALCQTVCLFWTMSKDGPPCLLPWGPHSPATWPRVGKPEMKAQRHGVPAVRGWRANSHLGAICSLLVAAPRAGWRALGDDLSHFFELLQFGWTFFRAWLSGSQPWLHIEITCVSLCWFWYHWSGLWPVQEKFRYRFCPSDDSSVWGTWTRGPAEAFLALTQVEWPDPRAPFCLGWFLQSSNDWKRKIPLGCFSVEMFLICAPRSLRSVGLALFCFALWIFCSHVSCLTVSLGHPPNPPGDCWNKGFKDTSGTNCISQIGLTDAVQKDQLNFNFRKLNTFLV